MPFQIRRGSPLAPKYFLLSFNGTPHPLGYECSMHTGYVFFRTLVITRIRMGECVQLACTYRTIGFFFFLPVAASSTLKKHPVIENT